MKLSLIFASTLIVACSGIDPTLTKPGNTETITPKTCYTSNAMYKVSLTKISGNCDIGNVDDQYMNESGKFDMVNGCADHSEYDPCTTYYNTTCNTKQFNQQITGELDWYNSQTSGTLTYTTFFIETGALYCQGEYSVSYSLE